MRTGAFISYCSEDKEIAFAVCEGLEARNIRCWIAPRDVLPGSSWSASIVSAIESSVAMVLIFSRRSNSSPQVVREIERAVNKGTHVIPFRIEQITPSKDLEYFISSCHWLDATDSPLDRHIARLGDSIRALETGGQASVPTVPESRPRRRSPAGRYAVAALALFLVLAAIAYFCWPKPKPVAADPAVANAPGSAPSVTLTSPADGASFTGALLLVWTSDRLEAANLSFEVSVQPEGKAPIVKRLGRNSFVPDDLEGPVRWKVRPIWRSPAGAETTGAWSPERSFTYYASSLRRIVATHTLTIGTAEADEIFVSKTDDGLTGYEIETLREIFTQILRENQVSENLLILHKSEIWGEKLFTLLDTDPAVDLLASGISITPERRREYAIDFTDPTYEYPQSLITQVGTPAFTDGKLVTERIGAVERTTNETLARQLVGVTPDRLKLYSGSGSYDRMLGDIVAGKLDGALIDRPYAAEKLEKRRKRDAAMGIELTLHDITPAIFPAAPSEKIGFAVRKSDPLLLRAINSRLPSLQAKRRALGAKFIPGERAE